jgi:hypothetical protein
MMGPKKLSAVRQELRSAIKSTGEDPLRWLERRIAESERRDEGGHEVLDSLLRLLKAPESRRHKRGRRKK